MFLLQEDLSDIFDLEMDVDQLFSCTIAYFANEELDARILTMDSEAALLRILEELMGQDSSRVVEVVIDNPVQETKIGCPKFCFYMHDYHDAMPMNYRLENFMRSVGIRGLHARCTKALVVGVTKEWSGRRFVSIPEQHLETNIEKALLFGRDVVEREIVGDDHETLLEIQGMFLPVYLPQEIQWRILRYCRSPCAEIMHQENKRIERYWYNHFKSVFCFY